VKRDKVVLQSLQTMEVFFCFRWGVFFFSPLVILRIRRLKYLTVVLHVFFPSARAVPCATQNGG